MQQKFFLLAILVLGAFAGFSQTITMLDSSQAGISFRGMQVVNDRTIWVSGSKGTVGLSVNGGSTWSWVNPAGFANRDFRDIVAFDSLTAITMAVDSPGILLKTIDGGKTWRVVYENHRKGIFLDDLGFRNADQGMVLGDPMDGRFFIVLTLDGGEKWKELLGPMADPGEACFAASGTNIHVFPTIMNGANAAFVSGGSSSKLHWIDFRNGTISKPVTLPMMKGASTTGANSICFDNNKLWVAGGDFADPMKQDSSLAGIDMAAGIVIPLQASLSYKSCIQPAGDGRVITCGTTGIAISAIPQPGSTLEFNNISTQPFHVMKVVPGSKKAFLAGPNGSIATVQWE